MWSFCRQRRMPPAPLRGGLGVTLPPGVLTQDLLNHGLAGQDPGLQVRDAIRTAELAVLQRFLGLELPTIKPHGGHCSAACLPQPFGKGRQSFASVTLCSYLEGSGREGLGHNPKSNTVRTELCV